MQRYRLFLLGVLIHVIFLLSIFDIYFKSPIVPGIAPQKNTLKPPTNRVVLISADGLRFDSVFDKDTGKDVAPYIRYIMREKGTWGLSQSHVPTESRPGHVAMLAGFYEDPSAVTQGWKENPVDFDSIFNQTVCSFAWGSPDILNIFHKGLHHDCAYIETYDNEQNFAGNTMEYDNWVYQKITSYFQASKQNPNLFKNGTFFFVHLLGQDTSGHTDKPHTEKYRQNLRNVDEIVKNLENLFENFYGDNSTTYIFTSDHGMTDWGSHGSGDPTEINTPFIAWGNSIKKPKSPHSQINIEQADITPLLAVLLGVPIPVNSVGILPTSYLNISDKDSAEALLVNTKQMAAHFLRKLQLVEEQMLSWFYRPFSKLVADELQLMIKSINVHIDKAEYEEAVQKSKVLIDLSLEGLDYYHNYHQRSLLISISLSYVGWIIYLMLELTNSNSKSFQMSSFLKIAYALVTLITVILITVQKLPLLFYCYYLLPEFLWFCIINQTGRFLVMLEKVIEVKNLVFGLVIITGVEVLVYGFFQRWVLSISITIILFWSVFKKTNKYIKYPWLCSGFILLVFPILPVATGQSNHSLVGLSGIGLVFFSIFASFCFPTKPVILCVVRCIMIAIAVGNSLFTHSHFDLYHELLLVNQCISWCLCLLSIITLILGTGNVLQRLLQIFIGLAVPFLLLSTNYEGFFLLTLFVNLFCWIHIEWSLKQSRSSKFTVLDFRRSYFFLTYIWIAFFGIGNIASLNSFDPAWVRCFLTTFSPFVMSFLILLKTIIPFLAVTCTMRALTATLGLISHRLFIIVLIYCNIMGLNFLYLIRNKGSWLDIGTSISHYVIQQLTIVFLVMLYGIAKYLLSFSLDGTSSKKDKLVTLPIFATKEHKLN